MQYGAFGNMLCKNDKSREKKFSIWSSLFCIIVSCDLKYSLKWQDFFTVEWQQFFSNIALCLREKNYSSNYRGSSSAFNADWPTFYPKNKW